MLAPRRLRGFSMVELMVAMMIALIAVIIMFQVFETSEGVRRTTASGGDAQQNGTIALYTLQRDLRSAGMGINETAYAGCPLKGYDSARTTPAFPPVGVTMVLSPALITPGATANVPDQLAVFYGSKGQIGNATQLTANMNAGDATSPLQVYSRFGFRPGDLVLLLEPGSGKDCIFVEITSLDAAITNQVNHDNGSYTLSAGASVDSRFNPVGGLTTAVGGGVYGGVNSANVTRVYNLGNLHDDINFPGSQNVTLPVYNVYAIANKTLTVANQFVIATAGPGAGTPIVSSVADNIVHMRVEYGVDDGSNDPSVPYNTVHVANDGIVDKFTSAVPNWSQVIAIRIALVARSALPEKKIGAGPGCDATTAPPTWSGDSGGARSFDLSLDPSGNPVTDWQCYRYQVFETTVPLRNWIWKST